MIDYTYGEQIISESDLAQVWQEIDMISPAMTAPELSGAAENKKSGKGFFADKFIAETMMPKCASLSKFANHEGNYSMLVNYYSDDDYYKPHTDDSKRTMTIFLSKKDNAFEGGDFKFNDFNITIPFKNNSYVLFEGKLTHEVTPVKLKNDTGRYSLTYFFY
jgi:Rps23 Pro-64 3,4-dihydroxylase Tpa1-like proline 4-hydroxylase